MRDFEALCRENYGRVYKYIFALTGSREPTEDLMQDVFTVAFEKGTAFLQHENPTAFLYRTARNLTLTYLKRQQRSQTVILDDNLSGDDGDLSAVLIHAHDSQIDETIYAGHVIDGLSCKQKALYDARYVQKKPIKEIAQEAGVNEPALRMRLVRLRQEIAASVKNLKLDEK